jgi:hypothetical protein
MEDRFMMFDGEVYNVDNIEYKNRPWENEAFKKETGLKTKLKELLF